MYEILAPAGNKECALAAIHNGAGAIYLGYSAFSARASAENFDLSALSEIVKYAHLFGVKVYVTMNTVVKDAELEEFLSTLVSVWNVGADAILLQDMLLGKTIHKFYPEIVLHLSTQAGVNNLAGALLAKEYGFSRVVLARETSFEEIEKIAKVVETEAFVQGALCTCFSGQCYFSSFVGGNSGNRGRCKQPCRKKYSYDTFGGEKNYALSLADLSLGEDALKLYEAGVVSFKIEGRMRRAEYVASAVNYYKKIFEGKNAEKELSELKRTYNRGNYTKGLAFGQDKKFISSAVQGHIGEKVGCIKVINGKYLVESREEFSTGDGFKILRSGEEVGGATFAGKDKRGFYIISHSKLKNGDGVFITTDVSLGQKLLSVTKKRPVSVSVSIKDGIITAQSQGITRVSDFTLDVAKNSALTKEETVNCFKKTDDLPLNVNTVDVEMDGEYFAPKSKLNGFRREFFLALYDALTDNGNVKYEQKSIPMPEVKSKNLGMVAVIGEDLSKVNADIYIHKIKNYGEPSCYKTVGNGKNYLYLPAFLSSDELSFVEENLQKYDGVYAEGYYGVAVAKKHGKKLFAGTGLNACNAFSATADEYDFVALSKELSSAEQRALAGANAFVLTLGDLKIMDLIYCPFGKRCTSCEKRERYTLTDENDRKFTLRRYKAKEGACRFELYNCASLLAPQAFASVLIDLSLADGDKAKTVVEERNNEEKLKGSLGKITNGHSKNGVL